MASFLAGSKFGGYAEGGYGRGVSKWLIAGLLLRNVAAPT